MAKLKKKQKQQEERKGSISLITIADPKRYVSQQFDALYETIQSHYASKQFIAVTSANAQCGKSTIAGNLAIVSALHHKRTLLVDANIHHSVIAKTFDLLNYQGLTHYLNQDDVMLPTVLQPSYLLDNLDVLTAGADTEVSLHRLDALFDEMKHYYDCIIFDMPTLQRDALEMALLKKMDLNLMVVRKNYSQLRDVKKGTKWLQNIGKNMAIVENEFTYSS